MTSRILEGLTDAQREAVLHHRGPAVVAAGAGSGKTKVIVHRMAYLVDAHGVHPARILAVTFSKAGADEMTRRVRALGCSAEVRTFHGLALRICREDLEGWSRADVSDGRYDACIRQAIDEHEKTVQLGRADQVCVEAFIDRCKSNLVIPVPADFEAAKRIAQDLVDEHAQPAWMYAALPNLYHRAEQLRAERGVVTFACMLCHAVRHLRDDDMARRRWAALYDYVIQDECQDQDPAQLQFAALLARDHGNYMIVGDPAQSIYGFRGADPTFMVRFAAEWPGTARYTLDTNFRSGASIIDAANAICRGMPPESHLGITMKPSRNAPGIIHVRHDGNDRLEATRVAREIRTALDVRCKPDDFAILLRVGAATAPFEDALLDLGVPYYLAGVSFYGRREVGILVSYLRVAAGRWSNDDLSKCLRHPTRYLGARVVDALAAAAGGEQPNWPSVVERVLRTQGKSIKGSGPANLRKWARLIDELASDEALGSPVAALAHVIAATDFEAWLTRDAGVATADDSRAENVERLRERAARFATIATFLDAVDEALEQPTSTTMLPDKVVITTIHRSKGLEWPVVYLPLFAEGVIPHVRAEIVEERRLAYVAFTRARDELRISCPQVRWVSEDRSIELELSSFVHEGGIA